MEKMKHHAFQRFLKLKEHKHPFFFINNWRNEYFCHLRCKSGLENADLF